MEDKTWIKVCSTALFISFILFILGGLFLVFETATASYILPRYGVGMIIFGTVLASVASSVSNYFKKKYAFDSRRITVRELRSYIRHDILVWLFIGALYFALSFYLG